MTHQFLFHIATSPTRSVRHFFHPSHILKNYRAIFSLITRNYGASSPYPNLIHTQNKIEQFTPYLPKISEQTTPPPTIPHIDNSAIIQYSSTTQYLSGP